MPQSLLYQWENELGKHFHISLNSWQVANVALFSYGIGLAESSQQTKICGRLGAYGKRPSLERRLQRFLANKTLKVSAVCRDLIRWVWTALGCPAELTLLVDETKLSAHLGIMMVGLAYDNRCLPLGWQCYEVTNYPRCGQVGLIFNLLMHVKKTLPTVNALVLADRGIGTSPRLCRLVDEVLGWRYLFRVTCQTKIVTADGDYTIAEQVQPGEIWYAKGNIFKQRGKIPAHAYAIWSKGYDEPWALVTNDPLLTGFEYAHRNWQEQSFRDLKSGGWHWDTSHVWLPDHARRLLVLLVIAYIWMVALGSYVFATHQQSRPKTFADGHQERRYSVFREGLFYWYAMLDRQQPVRVRLIFYPPAPP